MPTYAADNESMAEFLKSGRDAQAYYLRMTIGTTIAIVSQYNQEQAKCISDWYTSDPSIIKSRNTELVSIMEKYPDNLPVAIVLAVTQKHCGKIGLTS